MASETSQGTASISPPATPPPIPKAIRRRSVAGQTVPKCETGTEVGIDAVAAAAPAGDHEKSIQEDRESEREQPPETTDKADEDLAEQDQEESQDATPTTTTATTTTAAAAASTTTTPRKASSRSRARIKDLEAAIATLQKQRREMIEDIELYKLDIVGFKKDLARRDAHLHDLQFSPEIDTVRAAHARTIEELRVHRASANAVVARRDAEIARLETVVAGLKQSISANTRVEEAVGDEVFRDSWGRIGYDVMNWCLANGAVKGGVVDMQKLDDATREELLNTVPAYEKLIKGGHRVHVVQSLVAARLIREVFGGWFLGLSPERDELLRELEKDLAETSTPTALNHWRASTRLLLRSRFLSSPTALTTLVSTTTSQLLSLAAPFLPPHCTPGREKSLTSIVDQTVRVVMLMRCQRANFRVGTSGFVGPGSKWDPECMEDLTGEEEEGASVACVAWPEVEKWGDEMGERQEVRNCVVRARVVCMPVDEL